ncbi:MAG: hypothetical protein ACJA0G_001920 [Kangiellaceae bacterium]|jgi:hypothetical protein
MPKLEKGKYKHYKGHFYEVIDVVQHSEDESFLVLYRPLYGEGRLWVRPYNMFVGKVHTDKGECERFSLVS